MPLRLQQKQAIVEKLSAILATSISVVVADYRGLTVDELTKLRSQAREQGVRMGVYRNTLARRAVKESEFACLSEVLTGPMVLFFSLEEPSAAARLVSDFIKKNEQLEVKALALDGQLLAANQLKAVASLPSRQEALGQLASVMLAPITQFVRTLNEPVAQAVRVLGALRDSKQ